MDAQRWEKIHAYVQSLDTFPGENTSITSMRELVAALEGAERRATQAEHALEAIKQRLVAFAGQIQAWGYDAAAAELLREVGDGPVHAPDYDALVARLTEVEADRDRWRALRESS